MNIQDILAGVISTIIVSILVVILTPLRKKLQEIWKYLKKLKQTGLEELLPLDKFSHLEIFEKFIEDGNGGENILIVGRTLRWLFEKRRDIVMNGLEKGITFKILILNPDVPENNPLELERLQLDDIDVIKSDLEKAISCFISILDEAENENYLGNIEIKISDFIIPNSLISYTQKNIRKIILDFSFSSNHYDKFQQYFIWKSTTDKHFCTKLHDFYENYFNKSKFYISYSKGKISRSSYFIRRYIKKDISNIADSPFDFEQIRKNNSKNYLSAIPRLFNAIIDNHEPPPPISVQFEITNKCNTLCEHCKRHLWPAKEDLSLEQIEYVLKQLRETRVKTITISGGEPLRHKNFSEIIEYANRNGLSTGILSNGLNIDSHLANVITQYSNWIRISLDGSNNEYYQKVRNISNGINNIERSIKNLETAKLKNNKNFRIGICYSIQKMNSEDILNMLKLVNKLDLSDKTKILTFKFVHGHNGFLCDDDQLTKIYNELKSIQDKSVKNIANIDYLLKFMSKYSNKSEIAQGTPLESFLKERKIRCFTPYLFSLIDAYGDVYPCCFLYHDNDNYDVNDKRIKYKMGNIFETPFKKIWSGDSYKIIRQKLELINIDNNYPECKECTRHFLHNIFLTQLFSKYNDYRQYMGVNGRKIFQQILEEYSAEKVWL